MRMFTSSLVAAGAVAGIVGAVVSYQSVSDTAPVAERSVSAPAMAVSAPGVTRKLLPCEKGTKLVKGTCVRTKHRIVIHTIPAPVVVTSPALDDDQESPSPTPIPTPTSTPDNQGIPHDDDATEDDHGDDDGEGYGEDHEDHEDHGEDDGHEEDD